MDRQSKVFKEAVGSVVKIMTGDGGVGTGFVARDDGLSLTAAHVAGWAGATFGTSSWNASRFSATLLIASLSGFVASVSDCPA